MIEISNMNKVEGKRNYKPLVTSFFSSTFVNKVIGVVRKMIVDNIVTEINRNGKIFGLEVDTSKDISSKEQLSVVVKYVDHNGFIFERTVLFIESQQNSGRELFKIIEKSLVEIGLNLRNVVGISTDGASSMRSDQKGLIFFLKTANPNIIYTWCFSHRFNLAISFVCNASVEISLVLGFAEEIAVFIKDSYKRMAIWTDVVKSIPEISSLTKLKLIGQTRWSAKHNAINNIIRTEHHLFAIVKTNKKKLFQIKLF